MAWGVLARHVMFRGRAGWLGVLLFTCVWEMCAVLLGALLLGGVVSICGVVHCVSRLAVELCGPQGRVFVKVGLWWFGERLS